MIIGVGLDLVETERMARALEEHGERLERRLFTESERADCRDRSDRVLALAARFAAKEACLKALGTGWAQGLFFRQVEVCRAASGVPTLRLEGSAGDRARALGVRSTWVSLTHERGMAAALVVLEGDPPPSDGAEIDT